MEHALVKGTKQESGFGVSTYEQSGELAQAGAAAEQRHEIQGAIMVAKQFPRNETVARARLLQSCERLSFAEDAMYRFPRGGSTIEGPSVNLAREAGRLWGNLRYGLAVIRDDEDSRLIRGVAWDLESNTKVATEDEFRKLIQRKQKNGKTDWVEPDERDLRELTNRRGAICVRNAILQLLPKDVIEDAMAQCKATLRKGVEKQGTSALAKLVTAFASVAVTAAMLKQRVGNLEKLSPAEIAELWGVYRSIADGAHTWSDFKTPAEEVAAENAEAAKSQPLSDLQQKLAEQNERDTQNLFGQDDHRRCEEDTATPPLFFDHRQKIFDAATIEEAQAARKDAMKDTRLKKEDHEILDKALDTRTKALKGKFA